MNISNKPFLGWSRRQFLAFCGGAFAAPICVPRAISAEVSTMELPLMLNIQWRRGPNLPQGFQDSDGGIISNHLVTACGFCAGHGNIPGKEKKYPRMFLKKAWALDLKESKQWMELPDWPGSPRQELFGIDVDNKLYLWGGFSYDAPYCFQDGYSLELKRGEWSWTKLPSLPSPAGGSGICAVDSKIYVLGGSDYDYNQFFTNADRKGQNRGLGRRFLVFDAKNPEKGWELLPDCPGTPRWVFAMAAVGGKIYVIGGATGNDNPVKAYCTVIDNWMYDPTSRKWQRLPDTPIATGNFPSGAIVFEDRYILLVGGAQYSNVLTVDGKAIPAFGKPYRHYTAKDYYSDILVYDSVSKRFGRATPLPLNNNLPMTVVRGNEMHLIGGETAGAEIDGEQYAHHPDLYLVGLITKEKNP